MDKAKGVPVFNMIKEDLFNCQIYRERDLGISLPCEVNILITIISLFFEME